MEQTLRQSSAIEDDCSFQEGGNVTNLCFHVSMDREGAWALSKRAWTSLDKQGVYPGTRAKLMDMDMDIRKQVMNRNHHGLHGHGTDSSHGSLDHV